MGIYYNIVNPARRQFIDIGILDNPKLSGLMRDVHSRALGLLLWDEHRCTDPFSLIGSWTDDTVYIAGDDEGALIVRSETEWELPYCIDTRSETNPDRNLYAMAQEEFEEISGPALALVCMFQPAFRAYFADWTERCKRWANRTKRGHGYQRVLETIDKLVAAGEPSQSGIAMPSSFSPDERFVMVQPATKQYVSAARVGEEANLRHLLNGWHGVVFGRWLLWGDWRQIPSRRAPVYAAGEFSTALPRGISAPPGTCYRNLFQLAHAEYTEVSYRFLDGAFLPEMVAEARDNPALLAALGNAVFEADLKSLEVELRQQLGESWLNRYLELIEGVVTTPSKLPSTELVNDANLREPVLPCEATGNDEVAVLRCILFHKTQPLVFRPTTTMPGGWHTEAELAEIGSQLLKMTASGLESETIDDFLEANRKPWPVIPDLIFDERMVCLSATEMAEMNSCRDDFWERYRERHRGAIELIEFSRVGFNRNRTQALLYTGSRMNWNAGEGGYHLLSKSANGWSCVASEIAWVS